MYPEVLVQEHVRRFAFTNVVVLEPVAPQKELLSPLLSMVHTSTVVTPTLIVPRVVLGTHCWVFDQSKSKK
jgi:hypothetical protein